MHTLLSVDFGKGDHLPQKMGSYTETSSRPFKQGPGRGISDPLMPPKTRNTKEKVWKIKLKYSSRQASFYITKLKKKQFWQGGGEEASFPSRAFSNVNTRQWFCSVLTPLVATFHCCHHCIWRQWKERKTFSNQGKQLQNKILHSQDFACVITNLRVPIVSKTNKQSP